LVVDTILAITDPVNAALLAIIWWRLEKQARRVNRVETKIMKEGITE